MHALCGVCLLSMYCALCSRTTVSWYFNLICELKRNIQFTITIHHSLPSISFDTITLWFISYLQFVFVLFNCQTILSSEHHIAYQEGGKSLYQFQIFNISMGALLRVKYITKWYTHFHWHQFYIWRPRMMILV